MSEEHDDMLDTSMICFEGDIDTQVSNLLQYVRLTRHEVENLMQLFDDLEGALRTVWPSCHLYPFGSIVTGMGIRTSDVDCYVHIVSPKEQQRSSVITARNVLRRYPNIFQNLFAVVTAKVPIVKLHHIPTNRNCDISFKSEAGVRNSKLIAYLLHLDMRALKLAILIKYWSKVHSFTGTNLMPSYTLTLLVIFYLQQEKILPPVIQLQQNIPPEIVDHWNMAFDDQMPYISYNNKSLYHLLGGFFRYYSNFIFSESVVSLYEGKVLSRKNFENMSMVSGIYQMYKDNVSHDLCRVLRIDSAMCVQDPFDHSRNSAVAVFPKLADKIINYFKSASNKFEREPSECFLKSILTHEEKSEFLVIPRKFNPRRPPLVHHKGPSHKLLKQNNRKRVKNQFIIGYEEFRKNLR